MTSVVSSDIPAKRFGKRALIGGLLLLVAIALLAAGIYLMQKRQKHDVVVCTDRQLSIAKSAIDANQKDVLKGVVTDLRGRPGYPKDANCMFVLVKYYTMDGDMLRASRELGNFLAVYDSQKGLSPALSRNSNADVQALGKAINQSRQKEDNIKSSVESQI